MRAKRVSRPEAGKSGKVPVGGPQLLHSVLDKQRRDVGIVSKISYRVARSECLKQVGSVTRPFPQEHQ